MSDKFMLIPVEQILSSENLTISEFSHIVGLYNHKHKPEIKIESVDGLAYIRKGEQQNFTQFISKELLTLEQVYEKTGIPSNDIETMIQVCASRSDIPSNGYVSAISMQGKYYLHSDYLPHFENRFASFEQYIQEHEEELDIDIEERDFAPSYSFSSTEDSVSDEPLSDDDEEDFDIEYEDEEDTEAIEKEKQAKKKRQQKIKAEEKQRQEQRQKEERTRKENEIKELNKLKKERDKFDEATKEQYKKDSLNSQAIQNAIDTARIEYIHIDEYKDTSVSIGTVSSAIQNAADEYLTNNNTLKEIETRAKLIAEENARRQADYEKKILEDKAREDKKRQQDKEQQEKKKLEDKKQQQDKEQLENKYKREKEQENKKSQGDYQKSDTSSASNVVSSPTFTNETPVVDNNYNTPKYNGVDNNYSAPKSETSETFTHNTDKQTKDTTSPPVSKYDSTTEYKTTLENEIKENKLEEKENQYKQHQQKVTDAIGDNYNKKTETTVQSVEGFSLNKIKADQAQLKETQQQRIEIATIETINGNKYIVPESKKEYFYSLKADVEDKSKKSSNEIKKAVQEFERYEASNYESVSDIQYNKEKPQETSSTSSSSYKPTTSTQPKTTFPVTPATSTTSSFPSTSTPSSNVSSPSSDTIPSSSTSSSKPSASSTKTTKSDTPVILVVDGKSVAEISKKSASAIREVVNNPDNYVKGNTRQETAIYALVSSGIISDNDSLKTKKEIFNNTNNMNMVAVARDINSSMLSSQKPDDKRALSQTQIADRIVVSKVLHNVSTNDYTTKGIQNTTMERMAEQYKTHRETEGTKFETKNVTVKANTQNEKQKVIGNAAGTHANQTIVAQGKVKNTTSGEANDMPLDVRQARNLLTIHATYDFSNLTQKAKQNLANSVKYKISETNLMKGTAEAYRQIKTIADTMSLFVPSCIKTPFLEGQQRGAVLNFTKSLKSNTGFSAKNISIRARAKHAQHDLQKVNKILERHKFKLNPEDENFAKIDVGLGLLSSKNTIFDTKRVLFKRDKKGALLDKFLEDKGMKSLDKLTGIEQSLLVLQMKGDKNTKKLTGMLKERLHTRGVKVNPFALRTYTKGTGKNKRVGATTNELIHANLVLNKFIYEKTGINAEKLSTKQLLNLAKQYKDNEDISDMFFALASTQKFQNSLITRVNRSTASIRRFLKQNLSYNETFEGFYKMMDDVRKLKTIANLSSSLISCGIKKLISIKGNSLDKRIDRVLKKLGDSSKKYQRLNRRRDRYNNFITAPSRLKTGVANVTDKIKGKAKDGIKKVTKPAIDRFKQTKIGRGARKVKRGVGKARRGISNFRNKLSNLKMAAIDKLKNSRIGQAVVKVANLFKGLGTALQMLKQLLSKLITLFAKIIAIIIAIILLTNVLMYITGLFGNTIESLLGQEDFTETAAGEALISLQMYDKNFFAASDNITKQLQSVSLKETLKTHTGWFRRVFTDDEEIYGFIVPKDISDDKTVLEKYIITYAGIPYQDTSENAFQQLYYNGWQGEVRKNNKYNDKAQIITRYSNAKDILCVANATYGGEINKYWEFITDGIGKGSDDYCKELWRNTHFCGFCGTGIPPTDGTEKALCIHTMPLTSCNTGDCDGDGNVNKYIYYCNYNNGGSNKKEWIYKQNGWKYWNGTEEIASTVLEGEKDPKNNQKRLCIINPSIYGNYGSYNSSNKTYTFSRVHINEVGKYNPLTPYGYSPNTDVYGWPLGGKTVGNIASLYGMRRTDTVANTKSNLSNLQFHHGIDIRANKGTSVYAVASGTVSAVSYNEKYGHFVIINHKDDIRTLYAHLTDPNIDKLVTKDKKVSKGDKIGTVGDRANNCSNAVSGYHLHFSMYNKDNKMVDPMILFGGYNKNPEGNSGAGCTKIYCIAYREDKTKGSTKKYLGISYTPEYKELKKRNYRLDSDGKISVTDGATLSDDCNKASIVYCHENGNISNCKNFKTIYHTKSTGYSQCPNATKYYTCNGHTISRHPLSGTYENEQVAFVENLSCCGGWQLCPAPIPDPNDTNPDTSKRRKICNCFNTTKKNPTHYCSNDEFTSTSYPNCSNKQHVRTECPGHKVCLGHSVCPGHTECIGHTLSYCTGHTSLFTNTVIVGLNEFEKGAGKNGQDYKIDIMANSTDKDKAYLEKPGQLDYNYSTSFSMFDRDTANEARNAFEHDWADLYSITFYQENTPFKMTITETKSILAQQEHFRGPGNKSQTLARLALLSVGRTGYHDKYSTTISNPYQKLQYDKIDNEFFNQYAQFQKLTTDQNISSDSRGSILTGPNNETFVKYLLWSMGYLDSITASFNTMPHKTDSSSYKSLNFNNIACGDICAYTEKVNGKDKTLYGIVAVVSPSGGTKSKTGTGTVGIVCCSPLKSDTVYLIYNQDVINSKKMKFFHIE